MARRNRPPDLAALARIAVSRSQSARLKSSASKRSKAPLPQLDADKALTFAKILSAGVPAKQAIAYFCPSATPKDRKYLLQSWANSPLVVQAVNQLNQGEWHELSADRRLQIAMDKHDAELAYFLYRNNFVSATDDLTLAKMKTARESLRASLTDADDDRRGAEFRDMLADLLDGKLGPPQLRDSTPIVNMGENIPRERMQS